MYVCVYHVRLHVYVCVRVYPVRLNVFVCVRVCVRPCVFLTARENAKTKDPIKSGLTLLSGGGGNKRHNAQRSGRAHHTVRSEWQREGEGEERKSSTRPKQKESVTHASRARGVLLCAPACLHAKGFQTHDAHVAASCAGAVCAAVRQRGRRGTASERPKRRWQKVSSSSGKKEKVLCLLTFNENRSPSQLGALCVGEKGGALLKVVYVRHVST